VGLDLVDRGEDLPAHAVLDAGSLVDRQQEARDAELVDEEVRHADPRRTAERFGKRGVADRGAGRRAASRNGRGRRPITDGHAVGAPTAVTALARPRALFRALALCLRAVLLLGALGVRCRLATASDGGAVRHVHDHLDRWGALSASWTMTGSEGGEAPGAPAAGDGAPDAGDGAPDAGDGAPPAEG